MMSKGQRQGFTLLELIIVIIIIGILATLGFSQYTRLVERGRTAEAKSILGQIRTAQAVYELEYGDYSSDISNISIDAPSGCTTTHYFSYSGDATAATASRCSSGGKTPDSSAGYVITLNYSTGAFGGSAGYY
ncbi:MAG: prepilin-type N-terminal cleavage/methylation domain-containing protein [Candidatus Omnitrophota bacterium]